MNDHQDSNKRPLISVIVPVYNTEKFFPCCLDSIQRQTFTDFEVIVVDDGSTDHSGSIADEYAASDSRIHVIHKGNGGLSDARNVGLEHARGDVISYVDSDDEIRPDMLRTMYTAMQENDADIVVCGYYKVWPEKIVEVEAMNKPGNYDRQTALELLLTDKIDPAACNKLYRRKDLKREFPKGYYHEDNAVMGYWFLEAERITFMSEKLYLYRQRKDSIMHRSDNAKSSHDWFHCLTKRHDAVMGIETLEKIAGQRMVIWGERLFDRLANGESSLREKRHYARLLANDLKPFICGTDRCLSRRRHVRLRIIQLFPLAFVTYRTCTQKFKHLFQNLFRR